MGLQRNRERWQVMWIDDNNEPKFESMEPGVCPCKHCWCSESVKMIEQLESKVRVLSEVWKSFEPQIKVALSSVDQQYAMSTQVLTSQNQSSDFGTGGSSTSEISEAPADGMNPASAKRDQETDKDILIVDCAASEQPRDVQETFESHQEKESEVTLPTTPGTSASNAESNIEEEEDMEITVVTPSGAQLPELNSEGPTIGASEVPEVIEDSWGPKLRTSARTPAKRARYTDMSFGIDSEFDNLYSNGNVTSAESQRKRSKTVSQRDGTPPPPQHPPPEPAAGRSFQCPECHKNFQNAKNLKSHKRTHSGDKPFKCDECPKAFALRRYLNDHKKYNHAGISNCKCTVCKMSFVKERDLKRHKRTAHSVPKPYKCDKCTMTFLLPDSLETHKRIHSTQKYKCDRCQVNFAKEKTYKNHLERNPRCQSVPLPDGVAKASLDNPVLAAPTTSPVDLTKTSTGEKAKDEFKVAGSCGPGLSKPQKLNESSNNLHATIRLPRSFVKLIKADLDGATSSLLKPKDNAQAQDKSHPVFVAKEYESHMEIKVEQG